MSTSVATDSLGLRVSRVLARWRVALGFVGGIAALVLARPSATSLAIGLAIAAVGEALRVWAAGHLEKSREVTQSGPYAWTRHPLYLGSSIVGVGFAVATWHPVAAAIAVLYLGTTIPAAMRAEEAHLRDKFGGAYDAYASNAATPVRRAFSVQRALFNREHHTVAGLLTVMALLAVKAWWTSP